MGMNPKIIPDRVGQPAVEYFPEAATQSFVAGEVVYNNSGLAPNTTARAGANLGIVQQAASGTTSTPLAVELFRPGMIIECSTTNAGTAAAASGFTAGTRYGWYVASNVHEADLNATGTTDKTHCLIFLAQVPPRAGQTSYRGRFLIHGSGCAGSEDA